MRRDGLEPSSYRGAHHPTGSATPCPTCCQAQPHVPAMARTSSGVAVSLLSVQWHRCVPRFPCTERGPCPKSRLTEADGRRCLCRPCCREVFISRNPLRDIWGFFTVSMPKQREMPKAAMGMQMLISNTGRAGIGWAVCFLHPSYHCCPSTQVLLPLPGPHHRPTYVL